MFKMLLIITFVSCSPYLLVSDDISSIKLADKKLYMTFEEAFESPDSVYKLCQGGQNLNSLPEMISILKNLVELNLSQNNLIELPEEICDLKNLRDLNLSANYLKHLPENFVKLNKLIRLDLSVNTDLDWEQTFELLENFSKHFIANRFLKAKAKK